jgi:hypothetical protein
MTTRRTTITPEEYTCEKWLYGPQVSKKNASYSVGARAPYKWDQIVNECLPDNSQNPLKKLKFVTITALNDATDVATITTLVNNELRASKTIEPLLLTHSVFIIVFGKLFKDKKDRTILDQAYQTFYDNLNEPLKRFTDIEKNNIFTHKNNFKRLNEPEIPRPKNIFSLMNAKTLSELLSKFKVKTPNVSPQPIFNSHPIKTKCSIKEPVLDCATKFGENPSHPYFKPLSDTIACHCNFFKHKLKRTNNIVSTFDDDQKQDELSKGDYNIIKMIYSSLHNEILTPIVIKKYKFDENNVCTRKTYLSQLFEKCCILFYKPTYITPTQQSELFDTARDNILLANKGCGGFFQNGSLNVLFSTSIAHRTLETNGMLEDDLSQPTNTPVFFIIEDTSRIYYDTYCGPPFQFYGDVMKELLEYKVFIPNSTLFSNDRYVLNMDFNIEVLDFYKNFPVEAKTPELKTTVTKEFFRFVGNLMHFAIANNLELPFKLSRIYIMELFNLYDFTHHTPSKGYSVDNKLDKQLVLISTFLIEKASPAYHKMIMDIFENPELLKNPTSNILNALNGGDGVPSIHMNGYNTLTDAPDDQPEFLYNEGDTMKKVLLKVVEFLYKTAFKSYFENQKRENEPFNKDFKINSALAMFLEGIRSTKEFDAQHTKPLTFMDNKQLPVEQKLSVIRKADIYLSGFGITHDTIQKLLIPKIRFISLQRGIFPLEILHNHLYFILGLRSDAKHEEIPVAYNNVLPKYNANQSMLKRVKNAFKILSDPEKRREYDETKPPIVTMDFLNDIENYEGFKYITQPHIQQLIKKAVLLYKVLLSRGEYIPVNFINGYNEKMFQTTIPPQIMTILIEQENTAENVPTAIQIPEDVTDIQVVIRSNKKITKIVTTSDKHIIIPRDVKATYTYIPVSSGNQKNMTNEDYHNEFVKFLLKFWSASPNIANTTYTMSFQSERANAGPNDLIIAGTCFLKLSPLRIYTDEKDLYEDLVKSVIHTRFGEMLGGKQKGYKHKKPNKSKK